MSSIREVPNGISASTRTGVWAAFLVLFLPAAFFMLRPVFFPTVGLLR